MRHAVQFRSYAVKNASAPGAKAKKLKANKIDLNAKKIAKSVKDNRKFQNDKMLSEAEKVARRMDLESMKKNLKHHNTLQSDKLFSGLKSDKSWENDPLVLKSKQLGHFDEGLNDSSEDDDEDEIHEDTGKYFVDGKTTIKNKNKTLEDVIRESKNKKKEKHLENEKEKDSCKRLNESFRDSFRHILPKIAAQYKAKDTSDTTVIGGDSDFSKEYEMLALDSKPKPMMMQKLGLENSDKKNEKLKNNKINRFNEILKKAKIITDEEGELNVSDMESEESEYDDDVEDDLEEESDIEGASEENSAEEDSDEESGVDGTPEENSAEEDSNEDNDVSKSLLAEGDDDSENLDISDEEEHDGADISDEEAEDKDDTDEDDVNLDESDNQTGNLVEIESKDLTEKKTSSTISELKSTISATKGNKRKLETAEDNPSKKAKLDSDKTQIDCLRIVLETDLKNEALLMLSSQVDTPEMDVANVTRKLILAAIFQDALKLNATYSYSPELLRFLRTVLEHCVRNGDHWLSIKSDCSQLTKDQLLNMCTEVRDTGSLVALSSLFHTLHLSKKVIGCNAQLLSGHSLFRPFKNLLEELPTELYPPWLVDDVEHLVKQIDDILSLPLPTMTLRKQFKIVALLEPDLEDKFDPKKNVTKMLKKKLKSEKKAVKKDARMTAKSRVMAEVADGRKAAIIRDRKTLAIVNNLNQT